MNDASTEKQKTKQIQFEVPEDFHRKLKMLCALHGVTIREYVSAAVADKIRGDEETIGG